LLEKINKIYPKSKYPSQIHRIGDIMTDIVFENPSQMLAKSLKNKGANVFYYVFVHNPIYALPGIGAYHAADLPFTFGSLQQPAGWGAPNIFSYNFTNEERNLSNKMISAWLNLGKTKGHLSFGSIDWPKFDGEGKEVLIMNITYGTEDVAVNDYKVDQCKLWSTVYPGPLYSVDSDVDLMSYEPLVSKLLNEYTLTSVRYFFRFKRTALAILGLILVYFIYFVKNCCFGNKKKQKLHKKD